jgi:sensor domain CHASE-containing protein
MSNVEINIITFAITFVALLIGFGYQWQRELRNRRDDEAQRAELQRKVVAQAEAVAAHIEEKAEAVARALTAQANSLHSAITENTEVSTKAFHEANTVNLKLEKLGLQQQDLEREQLKQRDKGDR